MTTWRDRIRAEPVEDVPADAIPGRYLVAEAAGLVVSGLPARPFDHLAADPTGRWSASAASGGSWEGRFPEVELLTTLESTTLATIAERLDPGHRGSVDWPCLSRTSPLVRPTPEHLEPTTVDLQIGLYGYHLLEVCRMPHTALDAIVEKTPASLARRVAPQAVEYLAGHSEDWYRRTVTSVIPRRVLAQRVDERLDVYENRVVARLIDRLLDYLRVRLADLRRLVDLFTDVADFSTALGAQHLLARRLGELWGEGFGEGDELERIEHLERALLARWRRIAGLQDSDVYKAVPRRAAIAAQLRQTNVLTDHQQYRHVAGLWRTINRERSIATRRDEYDAWQRKMRAFDAFCLLLVGAAVERVGFAPVGDTNLELGQAGHIELSGRLGSLELGWDPMRGATIRAPNGVAVRFVPLAASLSGVPEPASAANDRRASVRVDELTGTRPLHDEETTVLLYPGTRRQRDALPSRLGRLLNPDDIGLESGRRAGPTLLPVSPLDILSLERVERVCRRAVLVGLLGQFPPIATCRRNVRDRLSPMADWLQCDESLDHLCVVEPPNAARMGALAAVIDSAIDGLRPRHDDPIRDGLRAFLAEVSRARSFFEQISWCPICGGCGSFMRRGRSHLAVRCMSCNSSWGLGACGGCGTSVPFLDAGMPAPAADELTVDALDRTHGRDVLAVPCRRPGKRAVYVCPACHSCPGGDERCGESCARAVGDQPPPPEEIGVNDIVGARNAAVRERNAPPVGSPE